MSGKGKIARVLLVALLSLVGLSVIGVGSAYAAAPVVKSLSPTAGICGRRRDRDHQRHRVRRCHRRHVRRRAGHVVHDVGTGVKITAVAPPARQHHRRRPGRRDRRWRAVDAAAPRREHLHLHLANPPTVTGTGLIAASATQSGNTVTVTAAGTWTAGQLVSVSGFTNKLPSAIYSVVTGGTGIVHHHQPRQHQRHRHWARSRRRRPERSGRSAGGSSVVIVGTHLGGASSVDFGSTPATSVTVNSATQITAVVPPGVSGSVDITVTTPNATSPTSTADSFNYVGPPAVTGRHHHGHPGRRPDRRRHPGDAGR